MMLFIIESQTQFPFVAFNFPARRFSPWRKAFENACLSGFVTIILSVLIYCTSIGVALFGLNVNFVLCVLKFSGCFMFNHVPSVCFFFAVFVIWH